MFNPANIIKASLVTQNIPENACFENFKQLLESLPDYLAVQIPATISNVIVSNVQPSSSQTTSIWFRTSNAGGFLGIYVFSQGEWHNIYPINDGSQIQLQRFYSETGTTPDGWTQVTNADTLLPAAVKANLIATNVNDPVSGDPILFWAYFSGF